MKKYFFLLSVCLSSFADASLFEDSMSSGAKLTLPPAERLENAQGPDSTIWLALDDPNTKPHPLPKSTPIDQVCAPKTLHSFSALVGHVITLPSVEGLEDGKDSHLDAFETLVGHVLTLPLDEGEEDAQLAPSALSHLCEG